MQPQQTQQQRRDGAVSAMARLPLDLSTIIADLLDYVSLLDFAMTCRKHKLASDPAKFRVVRLSFTSPENLDSAVTRTVDVLGAARSFQHVQHLELVTTGSRGKPMFDRCINRDVRQLSPWVYLELSRARSFNTDEQWRSLWLLLAKLPALKHLSWASIEHIPVQLVRSLNESQPGCRLHAYHFDLRLPPVPYHLPIELSQDAKEIATAPCLHSVSYVGLLDTDGSNNHFDIIMDMVAGAAPNLRNLRLASLPPPAVHPNTLLGRPPPWRWPRGKLPSQSRSDLGALRLMDNDIFGYSLMRCSAFTDFTHLKTLCISDCIDWADINRLTADVSRLPNLEELTVSEPLSVHRPRHSQPDALAAFITTLPCLSRLKLGHELDQRHLLKIAQFCAHRLKRLDAHYCLVNLQFIQYLQHICPFLEQLGLAVHRWAGSVLETAIYHGLGQFRMLEELQLRVRSFQAASSDGDFDALWTGASSPMNVSFFDDPQMDRIYFAIRDLAFDEALARSIFSAISSAKPPYARSLQRLQLWVDPEMNDSESQNTFLMSIPSALKQVVGSWLCVRDLSDLRPNHCFVKKTAFISNRYIPYEVWSDEEQAQNIQRLQLGPYGAVIRLAWPETAYKPFSEAWHSFPLHEG